MTHHFFGRNDDDTVQVMDAIYPALVKELRKFNKGMLSEEEARTKIKDIIKENSIP